jgi:preprotein translocase subunit Sss1
VENNIEMIENMLNTERRNRRGNREIRFEVNSNCYKAVSKLLSDYKRVLKENERLQKENEELKFKERSRIIGKYGDAEIHDVINKTLSNDYISVQKVKDKIEEYKNMLKTCNKAKDIDRIKAINERILELQELLEGRE